jgi:hypothetical protein
VPGHEAEYPAGELVVMDARVPLRGDRVHSPWCGALDEQLVLFASLPLKPEIDCVRRNRRGQRPKVLWRRARDSRELAETPVCQCGGAARRLVYHEIVVHGLGPEVGGVDAALFGAFAPCASGLMKRVQAGVSLVGWT